LDMMFSQSRGLKIGRDICKNWWQEDYVAFSFLQGTSEVIYLDNFVFLALIPLNGSFQVIVYMSFHVFGNSIVWMMKIGSLNHLFCSIDILLFLQKIWPYMFDSPRFNSWLRHWVGGCSIY
jgi:hypothetical protein